jgi:RNA polymerase sigma-70 factor (ECF subfamily)
MNIVAGDSLPGRRVRLPTHQIRSWPEPYNEELAIREEDAPTVDERQPDFDAVYATFYPHIFRYLTRLIGIDEAEDGTQEVFAKISRALSQFRNESQLSTWVYRIATNTAMDRVRSAGYRTAVQSVPIGGSCESESAGTEIASPACSVEYQTIRDEMSGCVQQLLHDLPQDYRIVLALSEMDGLKDREIAEVLGVSLETVKIRLHRARTKLRTILESQCSFYRSSENTLLCDIKRQPAKT